MFGVSDILLVVVVGAVVLMFGSGKLVEWAKALGDAKRAFSKANEDTQEEKSVKKVVEAKTSTP